MSRLAKTLNEASETAAKAVEGEVERMDHRPDHIDANTWELIQENGRIATERLNSILLSPKFMRLKASDQARLIKLAQDRAYGAPMSYRSDTGSKRSGKYTDVTAAALAELVERSELPEYKGSNALAVPEIDDEEEL